MKKALLYILITIPFLSLAQEIESSLVIDTIIKSDKEQKLFEGLFKEGYLNSEVISIEKKTDTTKIYKINLKEKTSLIRIDIASLHKELKGIKSYEFIKFEKDNISVSSSDFKLFTETLKKELNNLGNLLLNTILTKLNTKNTLSHVD